MSIKSKFTVAAIAVTYMATGAAIDASLNRAAEAKENPHLFQPLVMQLQRGVDLSKPPVVPLQADRPLPRPATITAPNPVNLESATEAQLCLAHAIFFEARGEPKSGQAAAANVILNRVADKRWPDTVCGVVYQQAQFSYTFDKPYLNLGSSLERSSYMQALDIAGKVLNGDLPDTTGGADHYYAFKGPNGIDAPKWATKMTRIADIGNHRFLK